MALRSMGLSNASSNFVNSYMMGKQVQAERAEADKQNQIRSMMGGMLMGQSSPEQQQEFSQLAPQQFVNTQNYLSQQQASQAAAANKLTDERDKNDLMKMLSTDEAGQNVVIDQRIAEITQAGGDASDSEYLRSLPIDQRNKWLNMRASELGIGTSDEGFTLGKDQQRFDSQGRLIASGVASSINDDGGDIGTEQRFFESKLEGLTEDQKEDAVLIDLGINPRAVSSADITIAESDVLTDQVANSKAIIGERKKFGELTGSSRSKAIDSGFERIVKIDAALGNIDRAIEVLGSGAGVGAIERFLPSFKAASVELDNIQNSMALDVIGAVTFGALSKGELDLAKEVALPTGLNSEELIEHLQSRRASQEKLREYFNEQIQFLDQGGTIAGFLRSKEGGADVGSLSDEDLFN